MADIGSRNSSTSSADRPMTTAASGAADSSTRLTNAWEGRAARSVAATGAREWSATATSTSAVLTAK
jgi:hypothetical protein